MYLGQQLYQSDQAQRDAVAPVDLLAVAIKRAADYAASRGWAPIDFQVGTLFQPNPTKWAADRERLAYTFAYISANEQSGSPKAVSGEVTPAQAADFNVAQARAALVNYFPAAEVDQFLGYYRDFYLTLFPLFVAAQRQGNPDFNPAVVVGNQPPPGYIAPTLGPIAGIPDGIQLATVGYGTTAGFGRDVQTAHYGAIRRVQPTRTSEYTLGPTYTPWQVLPRVFVVRARDFPLDRSDYIPTVQGLPAFPLWWEDVIAGEGLSAAQSAPFPNPADAAPSRVVADEAALWAIIQGLPGAPPVRPPASWQVAAPPAYIPPAPVPAGELPPAVVVDQTPGWTRDPNGSIVVDGAIIADPRGNLVQPVPPGTPLSDLVPTGDRIPVAVVDGPGVATAGASGWIGIVAALAIGGAALAGLRKKRRRRVRGYQRF